MSQRYKNIHDFRSINVGSSTVQMTDADSAITLSAEHSGDIILLNATGGSAVTLPAPSTGLIYQFIVSNTGGHVITAPSACINGSLSISQFSTSANLATGAAKTVIRTTTGSVIGDRINLVGSGELYFLNGNVSLFNAVNIA